MNTPVQQRSLRTRARLLDAAKEVIDTSSYTEMRVEEVVRRAGVAKGTFFAHFADKEALLVQLIGAEIHQVLDRMEQAPAPKDVDELIQALAPLLDVMTSERYVFDVIFRHSGAATLEDIGAIARAMVRQLDLFETWISAQGTRYRQDIPAALLAEGVQAFGMQALALNFCAIHHTVSVEDRLRPYLRAWLEPPV